MNFSKNQLIRIRWAFKRRDAAEKIISEARAKMPGKNMNIQWMPQLNDERKQCAKCGAPIKPFTNYFRATRDPDGGDEFGYDVCAKCRKELPDVPELTAKS